jgi:hypothetical protein
LESDFLKTSFRKNKNTAIVIIFSKCCLILSFN